MGLAHRAGEHLLIHSEGGPETLFGELPARVRRYTNTSQMDVLSFLCGPSFIC
jgi:hypothetical protein